MRLHHNIDSSLSQRPFNLSKPDCSLNNVQRFKGVLKNAKHTKAINHAIGQKTRKVCFSNFGQRILSRKQARCCRECRIFSGLQVFESRTKLRDLELSGRVTFPKIDSTLQKGVATTLCIVFGCSANSWTFERSHLKSFKLSNLILNRTKTKLLRVPASWRTQSKTFGLLITRRQNFWITVHEAKLMENHFRIFGHCLWLGKISGRNGACELEIEGSRPMIGLWFG